MHVQGVALVTGGASGLGLATAARLAGAGASVVLIDLPGTDGDAAAKAVGRGAIFVPGDVTLPAEVENALDQAAQLGPLRVLVNCAGLGTPGRAVGREGPLPLEQFTRVVTVNLIGTFNTVRLAAARMREQDPVGQERAVIVNTASVAAFDGQIGQPAYASSKGGIVSMTLPLAREFAAAGIRVMTIAPGIFDTPMLAGLPEEARQSLAANVPFPHRLGDPEEFAALVQDIVENPMLNGTTIRLDGALRMAPR